MALTKIGYTLIKDDFKTAVSGSDTEHSSSYSTRVTLLEGSGSITESSSSFSTRTTTLENANISGGFVEQSVLSGSGTLISGSALSTGSFGRVLSDTIKATNIIATSTVTAQEFHTEFVSASIVYDSGSSKFGDDTSDVHSITGSLRVSGSDFSISSAGTVSGSATSTGSFGSVVAGGTGVSSFTGHVGIGTNAPDTVNNTLHLTSLTGGHDAGIVIERNGKGTIRYDGGGTEGLTLENTLDNSTIRFKVSGSGSSTVAMFISGSGEVGIGTTAPVSALTVVGGTYAGWFSKDDTTPN